MLHHSGVIDCLLHLWPWTRLHSCRHWAMLYRVRGVVHRYHRWAGHTVTHTNRRWLVTISAVGCTTTTRVSARIDSCKQRNAMHLHEMILTAMQGHMLLHTILLSFGQGNRMISSAITDLYVIDIRYDGYRGNRMIGVWSWWSMLCWSQRRHTIFHIGWCYIIDITNNKEVILYKEESHPTRVHYVVGPKRPWLLTRLQFLNKKVGFLPERCVVKFRSCSVLVIF